MTTFQKIIRYLALAFAVFLAISIVFGILNAVGLVAGLFEENTVVENARTYTVSSEVTSLDITVNAADFTIRHADAFSVESNLKDLTVAEKDGVLVIEEKSRLFSVSGTGAFLTLYIPAEAEFRSASITTGAGRLQADALRAQALELELGAGEAIFDALTVSGHADIDGGAGKITVSDGAIHNLELDMGVGEFYLAAKLTGKSTLDLGIGESRITLIGEASEYSVAAEKGIGEFTVDGKPLPDSGVCGHGENVVEISSGIGSVSVKFKKAQP